jgi:hypothetical protein
MINSLRTGFEGKSVDIQNNINPSQQPRGYGGVAVLWKK